MPSTGISAHRLRKIQTPDPLRAVLEAEARGPEAVPDLDFLKKLYDQLHDIAGPAYRAARKFFLAAGFKNNSIRKFLEGAGFLTADEPVSDATLDGAREVLRARFADH